jgi:hypothetical protein
MQAHLSSKKSPNPPAPSKPTILLLIRRSSIIPIPSITNIIDLLLPPHRLSNILLRLQELRSQTQSHMPTYMTMHQPCTRVVRDERQHQVPVCGEHSDVPTGWVDVVECLIVVVDEGAGAGGEDVEVVAVQVDWVWDGRGDGGDGLDYPEGPLVGFGEGDDVGGGWEGGALGVVEDCLEGGLIPLGDDTGVC